MAVIALAATPPATAEDVALTFDDLPVFGRPATTADATATTKKLLSGLVRHHLPATGFVNEIRLEGSDKPDRVALLTRWLDAGIDLGNHSYAHKSLTVTPVDDYIADVARGETVTRALLAERGRSERWYRHPYLETGATIEDRQRFETWLADHGYRVAPVSMENSDWLFAGPYDDDLRRGDRAAAASVRRAYLTNTASIVPWYRQAALDVSAGARRSFFFSTPVASMPTASRLWRKYFAKTICGRFRSTPR